MDAKNQLELFAKTGILFRESVTHNRDAFKRNLKTLQDEAESRGDQDTMMAIDKVFNFIDRLENNENEMYK